jgi:predicted NBD/HSP70 family sugar kinase
MNGGKVSVALPAAEGLSGTKAVLEQIGATGGASTDGQFSAVAMLLVDSLVKGDEESLQAVQEWLQWEYGEASLGDSEGPSVAERSGRLLGLVDVSHWAIERVLPLGSLARLERGTYAVRFLRELEAQSGLSNQDVAGRLHVDETEVSRVGKRLLEDGLAFRRRLGRKNFWEISPKGRRSLQLVEGSHGKGGELPVAALEGRELSAATAPAELPERASIASDEASLGRAAGQTFLELYEHERLETQQLLDRVTLTAGVSSPEARRAVDNLLSNDFVTRPPEGGSVRLNPERSSAVGVNVTAHTAYGVVVGPFGNVLGDVRRKRLEATDVDSVVATVASLVDELLTARADTTDQVLGVGVALAGHVDGRAGRVVFSTELRDGGELWTDVPFADLLQQRAGLPVVVENDADALAIHEALYGDGRRLANFAAVLLGVDGLGSGIVCEGMVVQGHEAIAGELGHLVIDPAGDQCRCGNRGCLETMASLAGMRRAYIRYGGDPDADISALLHDLTEDDEVLNDVVSGAGDALGRGIAHLLNLLNPGRVVVFAPPELTDGGAPAGRAFQQAVSSAARQYSFSIAGRHVRWVFRPTDDSLGSIGAASLVLDRLVGATQPALRAHVPREVLADSVAIVRRAVEVGAAR